MKPTQQYIKNNLLRPVSAYEFNAGIYGNVVSRNKLKGKINLKAFRESLKIMVKRHILLNCVFSKNTDKRYFKKQDKRYLPLIIKYNIVSKNEKDTLYRKELNNILNPYKKLWRILLLFGCKGENDLNKKQYFEMIVIIHHSIGDGISLLNLVKEILEQTQAIQRNEVLYDNQILPIASPTDKIILNIMKDYLNIEGRKNTKDNNNIFVIDIDFNIDIKLCKINYIQDSFSKIQTTKLIKKCKENKITIHGIVCAAMLKAIKSKICNNPEETINILLASAVDCRRRFPQFLEKESLFCSAYIDKIICSINDRIPIITFSKQIIAGLNTSIENKIGLIQYMEAFTKNYISALDINDHKKNKTFLSVSNVGQIEHPNDLKDFQLYQTNFTASNIFPTLLLSILSYNESLSYTLLFTEPWWDIKVIRYIILLFKKNLSSFMNDT